MKDDADLESLVEEWTENADLEVLPPDVRNTLRSCATTLSGMLRTRQAQRGWLIVAAKRGDADTATRGWPHGEVRAMMYSLAGDVPDLARAYKELQPQGWKVFYYPYDEAEPLLRAKRDFRLLDAGDPDAQTTV